jgi:hypothetical protein
MRNGRTLAALNLLKETTPEKRIAQASKFRQPEAAAPANTDVVFKEFTRSAAAFKPSSFSGRSGWATQSQSTLRRIFGRS